MAISLMLYNKLIIFFTTIIHTFDILIYLNKWPLLHNSILSINFLIVTKI